MEIQVLGSGCPTCKSLYELVQEAAKELKIVQKVEYVTDINRLIEEGLATSPALKVNGKVVCAGRIPSIEEIKDFISNTSEGDTQHQSCSCGGCC